MTQQLAPLLPPRLAAVLTPRFRQQLSRAILVGEAERDERSKAGYPLHYPGQAAHAERCFQLDQALLSAGWFRSDPKLQVVFTSPCGQIRLVTMTASLPVLPDRVPTTRRKGPQTERAVWQNHETLIETFGKPSPLHPLTLFLLVQRTPEWVRAELALPSEVERRGSTMHYTWVWRELLLETQLQAQPERANVLPAVWVDFELTEKRA